MKAVWKKLIAVAFCGATAASMLSVGASAANPLDQNLIPYGIYADSRTMTFDNDYDDRYSGDVLVSMEADNYKDGKVTVSVDIPRWADDYSITYNWIEAGCDGLANENDTVNTKQTSDSKTISVGGTSFSAKCEVTVVLKVNGKNYKWEKTETVTVSLSNKWSYESKGSAQQNPHRPYYDSNYKYHDRWDTDNIYWDGDYYWYYSGGRWHSTSHYPGLPDWDRPSRPSYSKEYEVDWSDDTFYYNGKVQMPTATVTIGGRTIELDVKLISGDGKSVGRHRVRASLPSRYSRYDITGTTLYYEIEEPEKDGFVTENGNTYYYDNGRRVTGWQTINGSRYYFLDNGEAADGWVKDGPADWYYFSDGKMQTGWINDNGTTYYCYGTGKMCHGRWHEIAGKWYYFNESGAMLTSQWILDKGNWYYVAGDGVMATNTTVPGGYRVNASGVWVK